MALVPCRECSREISSDAPACSHCGCPKAQDATCRHCHRPVESTAPVCPHCGAVAPISAQNGPPAPASQQLALGVRILWALTMLGSVVGGFILLLGLVSSTGAPQQAAVAAIAVAFVVLPYCCARALSELWK
jgi:hypothetical protein